MKNLKTVFVLAIVVALSGILIFAVSADNVNNNTKKGTPQYFPEKVDFAGEQAPLHITDVRERFDRELLVNTYLHSSTLLILKRANRYFPVIEPILKQYNVPDDFKYLCVIESSLTNAVSSSGARGFWQFMTPAAKESGMEVNEYVDERYHLEKATIAACNYLISAKQKFGNWTLAAAAYNAGMNGINTKINEQQVNDYYDLLLSEETSRYIFRVLALKEIMKNPKDFGFNLSENELYKPIPTKKIAVDSTITDLALFAKTQGINYKILKSHNPWLRDKRLPNPTKKLYSIEIPTSGY